MLDQTYNNKKPFQYYFVEGSWDGLSFWSMMPTVITGMSDQRKCSLGFLSCLFMLCFRHHAFFFLAGFLCFVSGQSCSWLQHRAMHDTTMPARGKWPCFFPGKTRGKLPFMSAVYLAESRKVGGGCSVRVVKRNYEPKQLLSSAFSSTPSSSTSKM